MALSKEELSQIITTDSESAEIPLLMVGYNRRFSDLAIKAKSFLKGRKTPLIIDYVVNAGVLERDHWLNDKFGGGRNIGEACHMYDLFTFFTESKFSEIKASSISGQNERFSWRDNFMASISFQDGSLCNLVYTSMGNSNFPKESITIFNSGKIIKIDDFKNLSVSSSQTKKTFTGSSKGHYSELEYFLKAIINNAQQPIPTWELIQSSEISFEVEEQIQGFFN